MLVYVRPSSRALESYPGQVRAVGPGSRRSGRRSVSARVTPCLAAHRHRRASAAPPPPIDRQEHATLRRWRRSVNAEPRTPSGQPASKHCEQAGKQQVGQEAEAGQANTGRDGRDGTQSLPKVCLDLTQMRARTDAVWALPGGGQQQQLFHAVPEGKGSLPKCEMPRCFLHVLFSSSNKKVMLIIAQLGW